MSDDLPNLTQDSLPIVSAEIALQVGKEYGLPNTFNIDKFLEVRKRIKEENPEIERIMRKYMLYAARNPELESFFERGCQLTYELLRRQSIARKQEQIRDSRRST